MSADTAPAEMPGEDALIYEIVSHSSKPYGEKSARNAARAILALFAPLEAERRKMAMQALADDQQLIEALDRALAAEAALAAERERCAKIAEQFAEAHAQFPALPHAGRAIAAAIRG